MAASYDRKHLKALPRVLAMQWRIQGVAMVSAETPSEKKAHAPNSFTIRAGDDSRLKVICSCQGDLCEHNWHALIGYRESGR